MGADHAPHPPAGVNTAEAFLEHGREVLANQPFSVLLGAELTALSAGRCELSLALTPQLRQQHGFAHGVVSYMADNTLTYAGAQALHHGRTQAVCCREVYAVQGGEEKLCAVAQGTIAALPPTGRS